MSIPSPPSDVHEFIRRTASLVTLERGAEVEEEAAYKSTKSSRDLESAGVLLTRLVVTDVTTGLYGRCLLTLEPARGGPLKQSELGVRDIVELSSQNASSSGSTTAGTVGGSKLASGIVYRLKESSITLVLDEFLDPLDRLGQMSVLKLANQVTYDRYKYALDFLQKEFTNSTPSIASRLLQVLYAETEPVFSSRPLSWSPFSQSLNQQQKVAIQQALDANDVYMIHGPPGTGKTTTVVELIRQFVARGLKVLACAPSNLAVDNLVEKLSERISSNVKRQVYDPIVQGAEAFSASSSAMYDAAVAHSSIGGPSSKDNHRGYDVSLMRLGHPARIIPAVLKFTLDSVVKNSDSEAICQGIREDMSTVTKALDKSRDRSEKFAHRKELRELQKALREFERKAIKESLRKAEVICCTLTNCGSRLMDEFNGLDKGFDVVVIDEAAQALEIACLLPIMKGAKLILAGDNQQLGPVVKSKEACAGGFEKTLFDRLYSAPFGKKITTMLTEQYRMHSSIMTWASNELYQGRLTGPKEILEHRLCDLPGVKRTDDTESSFIVIDTNGLGMWEDTQEDTSSGNTKNPVARSIQRSKANQAECTIIKEHLDALLASGLSCKDLGVITPYNGQVTLLREMLADSYISRGLEVGTVDGFQGREKECILITMVRSNESNEVGFLAEDRRINVAITRARRQVCIVLDSGTVSSHPFLSRLIDYASEHGDYRMAHDPNEVRQDLSTVAPSLAKQIGAQANDASSSSIPGDQKDDGGAALLGSNDSIHHPPIVSQPKPKKVRPTPSANTASSSSATPSASKTLQPVEEEWPESRIEGLCEDVLKRGRKETVNAADSSSKPTVASYSFPSTLNSYQRQLVHSVAERVGGTELAHESTGEGLKRFIVLRYVAPTPKPTQPVRDVTADDEEVDDAPTVSASGISKKAPKKAAKKVTELAAAQEIQQSAAAKDDARKRALDAMELKSKGRVSDTPVSIQPQSSSSAHTAAAPVASSVPPTGFSALADPDEPEADNDLNEDSSSSSTPASAPSKNKRKKKAKTDNKDSPAAPAADADDDFDAMLSEFGSDVCKQSGCSTRVKVMGFTCVYCNERWCVKHFNPTLHGCGAAHKAKQLSQMNSALKHQQAGTKPHTLREDEKVQLQKKLEKKMKENAHKTKQAPKKDGDKKK